MKPFLPIFSLGIAASFIACSESATSVDNNNKHESLESFTDSRDNREYKKVTIGEQTWMAENLYFEKYFYTWEEAKKACPEGWHLPNDDEWKILFNEVGGAEQAGLQLKSTSGWESGENGKDKYGFEASPMGYRDPLDERQKKGYRALFWSATELDNNNAYNWRFDGVSDYVFHEDYPKNYNLSVRCIENNDTEDEDSSSSTEESSSSNIKSSSSSKTQSSSSSKISSSSVSLSSSSATTSSSSTENLSSNTKPSSSADSTSSSSVISSSSINSSSSPMSSSNLAKSSSSSQTPSSSSSINSCSSVAVQSSNSAKSSSSVVISSSSVAKSSSSVSSSSSVASSSSKPLSPTVYDPINQTLTDGRDGQIYKTITIGKQTWMAENLNYDYNVATAQSACYMNDSSNCTKYGRLYNWSALMDSAGIFSKDSYRCGHRWQCTPAKVIRGVCPEGWHVPSVLEWNNLFYVSGERDAKSLKANYGWNGFEGTDEFGFSILPAGELSESYSFRNEGSYANFWTANKKSNSTNIVTVYKQKNYYVTGTVFDDFYSVRCIMDHEEEKNVIPNPDHEIIYGTIEDTRDGNVYKTVQIGDRIWMAENLKLEYNEGSAESICPDNNSEKCQNFGRLYSWAAAMDSAGRYSSDGANCGYKETCDSPNLVIGICPEGWRLPKIEDFQKLYETVGGDGVAGRHLKGISGWTEDDIGYDLYGFNALPNPGESSVSYWSSTYPSGTIYSVYGLTLSSTWIYSIINLNSVNTKNNYSPVRCIKMTQEEINMK